LPMTGSSQMRQKLNPTMGLHTHEANRERFGDN
jgi:hypothetical protein